MQNLLLKAFRRYFSKGRLTIMTRDGERHELGDGTGAPVTLALRTPRAVTRLLSDTSLGFAESFMDGDLDVVEGDLLDLLQIAFLNGDYDRASGPVAALKAGVGVTLRRLQQLNTPRRARRNVQHHYDLSGDMYRLFLDQDMQYSCAYFEHPGQSLEDAQLAKKRHIAAKLCLEPGQHVLDIGSGWGGLGLYLAQTSGATVQGVTLSDEQLDVSRRRAAEAGLGERVRFDLQDYRAVSRQFDRIVSVGMFEHVGVNHYAAFFHKVAELLKRDGVMLLHTIGRSGVPTATDPFIRKHIFPGGYIPSMSEVLPHIERAGLVVTDIEILRVHYADTLKAWRARFLVNRAAVVAMYDERFCRMWELYLAGAEAAFRWGDLAIFQFQMAHEKTAVPLTRDYIERAEEELRRKESGQRGAPDLGVAA